MSIVKPSNKLRILMAAQGSRQGSGSLPGSSNKLGSGSGHQLDRQEEEALGGNAV